MRPTRNYILLFLLLLCFCLSTRSVSASSPPGPFEQVATTSIPAGFGELLNAYERSLTSGSPEALKEISTKLSFYAQTIGRVSSSLDIAGKLYLGDTKEAAISAGLLILGEAAGSEAGKAYLGAMGLTTLPVTTLITAFQIYRLSEAELKKTTVGLKLEQLYDRIERDPQLKNRSRELGTGDPIPVTPEATDYVWRKILLDDSWRDLFKTYVVEELGRDWPEPSLWSRWTLPGNLLEEGELYSRQNEYKSHIAGLLYYMNRAAKLREQQVIMRRYAAELQQKAAGMSSSAVLDKYVRAVARLPEVREFAKNCPAQIQRGLQGDDLGPLIQVVSNTKRYAVDVLAWIPASGRLGEERAQLLQQLQQYHDNAWSARKFLEERRRKEELRKAASARVAAWQATAYGFSLEFDGLRGSIDDEFQRTGGIAAVTTRIEQEFRNMEKHYAQQSDGVKTEYDQAQQMSPVPAERNEQAYRAFFEQWSAYRTIDYRRRSDLLAEISAYMETLQFRNQIVDDQVGELSLAIDRIILPFKTARVNVGALERALDGFCGEFPPSNYVGITSLRFPSYTPKAGDSVDNFIGFHNRYLQSLRGQLGFGGALPSGLMGDVTVDRVSFCGSEVTLSSLSAGIDQLVSMVDALAEKKSAMDELDEKIRELETVLADLPDGPVTRGIEIRRKKLEEEQRPFALKLRDLVKNGEALKGPARSAQQRYQTDLANIENDRDYFDQLERVLRRLKPTLDEFMAEYPRFQVDGSNGIFVARPEVRKAYAAAGCSALISKRVFMTESDIQQALRQLDQSLSSNSLKWFDSKYQIGLEDFVTQYLTDRSGFYRMTAPDHYTFIEWDGQCRLYTKENFDAWQQGLAEIERFDLLFPRQMNKAVGGSYGMLSKMLNMPVLNQPEYKVDIDVDNYPEDGLSFLKNVAENCWDDEMRASVMGVVTTFEEKMTARRVWLAGESYFLEVQERLSAAAGNLRTLLYEAQEAYNRNIRDPEVSRKYQQAAAKEPAIMAVLNGAVSDPKLSPQRREYFSKQKTEYEREFFFIRQWAGISERAAAAPEPQKPAFDEQPIIQFYDQFKRAYEGKNDSRLMSFLDDAWSAGDGTTLYDVEEYFRNMFNVFDEISLDMSGLRIESLGGGRYRTSYDLKITGRIFAHGIEHPEQSSVVEEIGADSSGRLRIQSTPQGRFWQAR